MKRLFLGVSIFGVVAFLGGCPIYPSDSGSQVCNTGGCYDCPNGTYSNGTCVPWQCSTNADCGSGYECGPSNTCVPASEDAGGDCRVNGCPNGYVCKLSGGATQCVPAPGTGGDAGEGDASATDSGSASDSGDASTAPTSCNADSDCSAKGAKCIDGLCTPQSGLCSDTTQCVASGEACVDGVCVPHCSANASCPAGYSCDFNRGVCDLNPSPCSATNACQGGSVCVEGHCAPPCGAADAGAQCPTGQVCVNGGCIPDQAATFACQNDGQSGSLATTCSQAQVCLHHDCYEQCDADGGACPSGQSCKQVTVAAGTYAVCGASTDLGSDCDPAAGKYCSSGVCIDGYCK